jgi:hypothetical protein
VREVFFYLCVCVRVFGILEWSRKWRDKIEGERRGGVKKSGGLYPLFRFLLFQPKSF